jgi:hypothetical protein
MQRCRSWRPCGRARFLAMAGMMALGVANGMDLGASTAFGAADTMGQGPPFPSPEQRWTLVQLLSINSRSSAYLRAEDIFPNTALGAAHEAAVERLRRPTHLRAVRPTPCTAHARSRSVRGDHPSVRCPARRSATAERSAPIGHRKPETNPTFHRLLTGP